MNWLHFKAKSHKKTDFSLLFWNLIWKNDYYFYLLRSLTFCFLEKSLIQKLFTDFSGSKDP